MDGYKYTPPRDVHRIWFPARARPCKRTPVTIRASLNFGQCRSGPRFRCIIRCLHRKGLGWRTGARSRRLRNSVSASRVHVSGALSAACTRKRPRWQTGARRRKLSISVRVDRVHVSSALSVACTGKEPPVANGSSAPKSEHFGMPRPPGTRGNPAGNFRCWLA